MSDNFVTDAFECLNIIANAVHALAKAKGWHEDSPEDRFGEFCANIHGEVSELWEAHRRGKLNDECGKGIGLTCIEEELADVLIRTLDMADAFEIDIGRAVAEKHRYNQTRSWRHGGKKA